MLSQTGNRHHIQEAKGDVELSGLQETQILLCTELAASSRVQSDVPAPPVGVVLLLLAYLPGRPHSRVNTCESSLFLPAVTNTDPLPPLTRCQ